MTQEEVDKICKQMVEQRVEKASDRMSEMEGLKDAYIELRKKGFHEGANAMRNTVLLFLIQNPDATEHDVVLELAKMVGL